MKKVWFYIVLLLSFFSCKDTNNNSHSVNRGNESDKDMANESVDSVITQQGILGYYVGMFEVDDLNVDNKLFYRNKITIAVESVDDEQIKGHSIVAGKRQPFIGKVSKENDLLKVIAEEPRGEKDNGRFIFELNTATGEISGVWYMYNAKASLDSRSYTLKKRQYEYNKDLMVDSAILSADYYNAFDDTKESIDIPSTDAVRINASNTELTTDMLDNLYSGDIEIIRNAIYARHGYSFSDKKMRYIFDNMFWYIPLFTNVDDKLTALEINNIDLLERYEEYFEEYYDDFGR